MDSEQIFPKIASVTDLRYRWKQLAKELEENELPILVVEHSTPRAVIFPFSQTTTPQNDPLTQWRKKHVRQFAGWDATKTVRKMRDNRWKLS